MPDSGVESDAGVVPDTGVVLDAGASPGWKPDMVEDFNATDGSRWNVRNNTSNSNEDSYLLASNVSIDSGALRIQGKLQSAGGKSYTSGYIDTDGKYALPDYFRLEIRAKVPLEMGMWAAPVWFRPADFSGGEIDLVETWGADKPNYKVHQTIHTDYGASHQQSAVQSNFVGDPLDWHIYVIEKTKGQMVMYVDGVKTATFKSGSPTWFDTYYEAGKTWNLRVNLQIGGARGVPDATTDWSADKTAMRVDYIHTWIQ
jgi:hypothetical protein